LTSLVFGIYFIQLESTPDIYAQNFDALLCHPSYFHK